MPRLIGVLILMVSALAVGLMMRANERKRIEIIRLSVSLLTHAKRKIDLFGTPACELFSDFPGSVNSVIPDMDEDTLEQIIARIVNEIGSCGEPLVRFSREIGTGYKEDALRVCELCIAQMGEALDHAEKTFMSRKKLYVVLPLLLAVSVIILLL